MRWHDLRHSGATEAARTGASLRSLQRRMGHSTVPAALIYQHATDADDALIAQRLDAHRAGALRPLRTYYRCPVRAHAAAGCRRAPTRPPARVPITVGPLRWASGTVTPPADLADALAAFAAEGLDDAAAAALLARCAPGRHLMKLRSRPWSWAAGRRN